MRQFLATQHFQFPELPSQFVDECISRQDNGYSDKLKAYEETCTALAVADVDLPSRLFADFKDRYGLDAIAFDGAAQVLEELGRSYKIGLISNGRTRGQMAKLESSGLAKFFNVVVISESHGAKKPNASIFEDCLYELGCRPSESVYVGDSPKNDIEPAMTLGIRAVWIKNSRFPPPASCTAVADGIDSVPGIVAKLNAQQGAQPDAFGAG